MRRRRAAPRPFVAPTVALLLGLGCASSSGSRPHDGGSEGDESLDAGIDATDLDADDDSEGAPAPDPASWTAPENISSSPVLSDLRMNWGNAIAVGAGGSVHVVWREVSGEDGTLDVAEIVHRRYDGAAWGAVEVIAAAVPGTGHPSIATAGSRVYVAWHRHHPDPGDDDEIFLSVSHDDGSPGSFGAPEPVVADATVSARSPLGEYASTPSVAARGDRVHLVWADDRHVESCGENVSEVYLRSSHDGGGSWTDVARVSEADCRSSWTPTVAATDDWVHVAWTDERHNERDCGLSGSVCQEEEYYRRLPADGSGAPGDEVRLTEDPPASPAQSWAPAMAVLGEAVHVVFMDRSGGVDFEVFHVRSLDEGTSWETPARMLSRSAPGCRSARGTVAGIGDVVHVAWMQLCGDSFATVEHVWSPDRGTTWSPPSDVTSGHAVFAIQPYVASLPGTAHVVWTDQGEIYAARTLPGSVR